MADVPTALVETAVPTRVVGTAIQEIFVPAIIVGTAVPTIIVETAYYWKSCFQHIPLHLQKKK